MADGYKTKGFLANKDNGKLRISPAINKTGKEKSAGNEKEVVGLKRHSFSTVKEKSVMNKKEKATAKKAAASAEAEMDKLRTEHPFETDSQIENRYGNGREKSGSDGEDQDNKGSNH